MPKKRQNQKKSFMTKLRKTRGSITFTLILAVIIIGSVLMVSGLIPQDQLTPQNPDAPTFKPIINEEDQDRNTLQLRTIDFESCSKTAAVNMLLDITGSMNRSAPDGQTKIKKLVNSTELFVNNMTDDSVIGIQIFNSAIINDRERMELIPISYYGDVKATLVSRIRALESQAGGNTPTRSALTYSLEKISEGLSKFPERQFSFIFVSDGAPTDGYGPTTNPDPAQQIKDLGVTVYSIGILDASQIRAGSVKQILDHVASSPDKSYIAPDGNQLTEIYQQIGTELCQSAR